MRTFLVCLMLHERLTPKYVPYHIFLKIGNFKLNSSNLINQIKFNFKSNSFCHLAYDQSKLFKGSMVSLFFPWNWDGICILLRCRYEQVFVTVPLNLERKHTVCYAPDGLPLSSFSSSQIYLFYLIQVLFSLCFV